MSGVPPAGITLPDRVTVLTCIGCGAMGRQERCDGACSEHKLVLVSASDYDALLAAADAARACAARLAPIVRELAEGEPTDPRAALLALRGRAGQALRETGRTGDDTDWASPSAVVGWWCARCGNVDMPQPCIGVCVWRPADWVSLALYERQLASLRGARSLSRFVARVAAVMPHPDQWQRNWDALRAQARSALSDYDAYAPPPGQTLRRPCSSA